MEANTTQTKGKCLVVADQALRGDQVRDRLISELGGNPAEVFVVAPALVEKALDHHMGDVDDARVTAQKRLEETLEELRAAGIKAEGEVGDSDPLLAISDEVAKFDPDRIFVIAHTESEELYAEHNLLPRLERDFDQPVTELIVEGSGQDQHVIDVEETEPVAGRAKGERPASRNFPPLTRRDIFGLVVAIVGTLVIGTLAAAGAAQDQSGLPRGGPARRPRAGDAADRHVHRADQPRPHRRADLLSERSLRRARSRSSSAASASTARRSCCVLMIAFYIGRT